MLLLEGGLSSYQPDYQPLSQDVISTYVGAKTRSICSILEMLSPMMLSTSVYVADVSAGFVNQGSLALNSNLSRKHKNMFLLRYSTDLLLPAGMNVCVCVCVCVSS